MDNKSLVEIAKLNNTTPSTVAIWRNRYIEHGIDGLQNKPRQGRPKQYGKQFQDDIVNTPQSENYASIFASLNIFGDFYHGISL